MAKSKLTILKKYLLCIKKAKEKHLTVDKLSKYVGVYPEIISENLSEFDPMIRMDYDFNVRDIVPKIEEYIEKEEENKPQRVIIPREEFVTKKELDEFRSVNDFIYKKMTVGGIFDSGKVLEEKELKMLKKIIEEELKKRKNKGQKKGKKRK